MAPSVAVKGGAMIRRVAASRKLMHEWCGHDRGQARGGPARVRPPAIHSTISVYVTACSMLGSTPPKFSVWRPGGSGLSIT